MKISLTDLLGQSQKDLGKSLKSGAKKTVAKTINAALDGNIKIDDKNKSRTMHKVKSGSTQEMVPIKEVRNGVIITQDNRYVRILEVYPVNFARKGYNEQANIINSFRGLFTSNPESMQFLTLNDNSNPIGLVKSLKRNLIIRTDPQVRKSIMAYLGFIDQKCRSGAMFTRYFLVYSYDEDSKNIDEIVASMDGKQREIERVLGSCGNIVDHSYEKENGGGDQSIQQIEILYYFFNRQTYNVEQLDSRVKQYKKDLNEFNKATGKKKELNFSDIIASKGMRFDNRKYMFCDGKYIGYYGIIGSTLPSRVEASWLSVFSGMGVNVDVSFTMFKKGHMAAINGLKVFNQLTKDAVRSAEKRANYEKAEKHYSSLQANQYVLSRLQTGQELYDGIIVLTIKADSARQLQLIKQEIYNIIVKSGRTGIDLDDCYDCVEEYFLMSLPLIFKTTIAKRLKHNFLTEQLPSIYPFTSYQRVDPEGFVIGVNQDNDSILSIDPFNKAFYLSANMVILGTTGAGKTFTEQLMATRLYYNGVSCYFIIPKKGEGYKQGCDMVGGEYILLVPGSPHCLNVLDIYPEKAINENDIEESTVNLKGSLLAKKTTSLITWLKLVMRAPNFTNVQQASLVKAILSTYKEYGITEDDNSLYEDDTKTTLKDMPIIEDLVKHLEIYSELEDIVFTLKHMFVEGTYKNFNARTNIDLSNHYIAFNVDEDIIGEELHPALLYIAFDFCYSRIKSRESDKSIVVLDEVWKMMIVPDSAKQVQNMVKLVRGYRGGVILATQEIEDFMKQDKDNTGKSVLNNCPIKLCLRLEQSDIDPVREVIALDDADVQKILVANKGEGILLSGADKLYVKVEPSEYEFDWLTDITGR